MSSEEGEAAAAETTETDEPSETDKPAEPAETTQEGEITGEPLKTSTPKPSVTAIPPILPSPRAGGFIKGLPSSSNVKSSKSKSTNNTTSRSSMSVFYTKSREHRINLLLEDSEWDFGEELDVCTPDTLADNMLAVTISCVMLMATDIEEIPEEYLIYAENYLTCVKDDSDFHPPNVQGILNHIAYLRETLNRKRDLSKETCKCKKGEDDENAERVVERDDCNTSACATRSGTRIKFKKEQSIKRRCGIPVRKKTHISTKKL